MKATDVEEGDVLERDDSRRLIKEIHRGDFPEVVYALYRRQHSRNEWYEWWLLREGSCTLATFDRWARRARLANRDSSK